MIKDLASQKLPRFKADESLLDQVTAERLNDICTMIESVRLQNGVGYILNRTQSGTTFSIIKDDAPCQKLWRIDLSDLALSPTTIISKALKSLKEKILPNLQNPNAFTNVFRPVLSRLRDSITTSNAGTADGVKESLQSIFAPIYTIVNETDRIIEEIVSEVNPIKDSLEEYFTQKNLSPLNGDYIYTNELGICYTLFREISDDNGSYPSPNLIFRIAFKIGEAPKENEEDNRATYYALTTFPAPDIAELVKTVIGLFIDFVSEALSSSFEGIIQSILDSVSEALYALYELLFAMIEEILAMIDSIWEAINSIGIPGVNGITDEINTLKEELTHITPKVKEMSEIISAAELVSVIGADGIEKELKVLSHTSSSDRKVPFNFIDASGNKITSKAIMWNYEKKESLLKDTTWIASEDGAGHRAKSLIWDEITPYEKEVAIGDMEYIGADGQSYVSRIFHFKSVDGSQTTGKSSSTNMAVCEDGQATTKYFVEIKQ